MGSVRRLQLRGQLRLRPLLGNLTVFPFDPFWSLVTRMPSGAKPLKATIFNPPTSVPAMLQVGALSALEDTAKDRIQQQMRPLALKAGHDGAIQGTQAGPITEAVKRRSKPVVRL